jgi:fumarate hydratase subunit alpha
MKKVIVAKKITDTIAKLCIEANLVLRKDVLLALRQAYKAEKNKRSRRILDAVIQNASIAKKKQLAICQDTGIPVVFVELGQGVEIKGDFKNAINKGIELGYKKAFLRNSIIKDPLGRGKSGYIPAVIHVEIVKGNKLKLTVLPKGFGCENKTQLKMFKPTAGLEEIRNFIIEVIKTAGPDACPPYVVGVGIGGTADYACWLAKKALLRKVTSHKSQV